MKEQIEQAVSVSITKKLHRKIAESLELATEQPKMFSSMVMPRPSKRRPGTISLSWQKMS